VRGKFLLPLFDIQCLECSVENLIGKYIFDVDQYYSPKEVALNENPRGGISPELFRNAETVCASVCAAQSYFSSIIS